MIRVTMYNEFYHEKTKENVKAIYPNGMHGAIKEYLDAEGSFEPMRVATLEMPEHGLTQEVLDNTDVLLWWGHVKHNDVSDEVVERVLRRVKDGMGFIALHSAHASKPFRALMGTDSHLLRWRESDDLARMWVVDYAHPIVNGIGDYFELKGEETYGEHFDIPQPDDLIFITWFSGGEVLRSGCTFHRGQGRIFYFQPGHETYPTYYNENVRKVIANAIKWAYNPGARPVGTGHFPVKPNLESEHKDHIRENFSK